MNVNKPFYTILGNAKTGKVTALTIDVTAKAKTAYISIKGNINNWRNSSTDIENQIKNIANKGAINSHLYINSGGGDVFEANEILNLIQDNFTTVTVKLGALCASAATVFVGNFKTTAKKNTKIMIHKPSVYVSGNEDTVKAKLKLLKDVTAEYKRMYADKMNITQAEVEELWGKGDYWLTAKEALKKGLIDAIEETEAPIDAETRLQLEACGAPDIPKPNNKHKNPIMDKLKLIALLGIDPNATDAQIEAQIKANKEGAAKTANLEAKMTADSKIAKAAKIKKLLDDAEGAKKITAEQRSGFEALASADFDNAKKVIEGMQVVTEPISAKLDKGDPVNKDSWTYNDYQENGAMANFEKLPQEKQDALIDAHYKE